MRKNHLTLYWPFNVHFLMNHDIHIPLSLAVTSFSLVFCTKMMFYVSQGQCCMLT
jgi:hypothetical protein